MSFYPLTAPADKVWLSQVWSPGIVDIEGANSPRTWEEFPGYGWSGAIVRFKGIGLAHFTLRFRLYNDQDWIDWSLFKPLVDKPPVGVRPKSKDVWHPLLSDQGIYALVVEDLGQPTQTNPGEWSIEVKCIEWRQPKYSLVTPDAAQSTPVDPIEQKIEERLKKLEGLLAR